MKTSLLLWEARGLPFSGAAKTPDSQSPAQELIPDLMAFEPPHPSKWFGFLLGFLLSKCVFGSQATFLTS